jgi:hypothetical protein
LRSDLRKAKTAELVVHIFCPLPWGNTKNEGGLNFGLNWCYDGEMAQESIARKVVAGVLIGIILAAVGSLANWLLPGVRTFFVSVWRLCIHLVAVPAWLLILLSLYVGTSLIRAYLRHRSQTQQNTQRAAEPNWRDYTCDVFHQIVWRWGYGNNGQPVQLTPFCFKCDTQIYPEIGHISPLGEKASYHCDNCGNQVLVDGSHEYVVGWIARQIQRKLRSPAKEWKNAIKDHAGRNP